MTEIKKMKEDIRNIQKSNTEVNTYMQQNNYKMEKKLASIESEIGAVKDNSSTLNEDFKEFNQNMIEKIHQLMSSTSTLSTLNDQTFLKSKKRNSTQETNKLEENMPNNNLLTKKLSETHPILQMTIRRRMNINIKRSKERSSRNNNVDENFLFDINNSITSSKNQEILDNYINEYLKVYESQEDIMGE
jgi:hypothetical protein